MAVTTENPAGATGIRPFSIDFPEAELEDLRARIEAPDVYAVIVEYRGTSHEV